MSTATYYFNSYDAGEAWLGDPADMVDDDPTTWATAAAAGDVQLLDGNTCDGTDLGNIYKVIIRPRGAISLGAPRYRIAIRPVFNGNTDGDDYSVSFKTYHPTTTTDDVDITLDSKAPIWSWDQIQNLDCDVEATDGFYGNVYKVELIVYYQPPADKDLTIYYKPFNAGHYIDCFCSRWDVQNYQVIIETWMNGDDVKRLREHIVPGATGELYTILGRPKYYDKTWDTSNTLWLSSNNNQNSTLGTMRPSNKLIYVKNISDSPVKGPSGWISCKIEGYISGSGDL